MSSVATTQRSLLPWLLISMVVACLAMMAQLAQTRGSLLHLPLYDYTSFWAAARLNAAGIDPYDPAHLEAVEREADPGLQDVLVMWSAPWGLALLSPFGRLDPQPSHLLWQGAQLGILLAALELLWRFFGGASDRRWIAWLVAFSFPPCYFMLVTGQLGALILLGFASFLFFQVRGQEFAAGACLALAAIKPQLTFLFWIALLLWAWQGRRWRVALGGGLCVLTLLALPWWENPHLPIHYWDALSRRTQTHSHESPVAGTALRLLFGPERFGWQFVPLVPGLIWVAWYWSRHRHAWRWSERLPALLFASFLAAPYGAWPFDLVVLLPPLLAQAVRLAESSRGRVVAVAASYAAIGMLALVQILCQMEYFWFLWMTPALLLLYLAAAASNSGPPRDSNRSICLTRMAGGAVSS